jgi:flavodoxin
MRALVVYDSKFGNTEQIARVIGTSLAESGPVEIEPIDKVEGLPPNTDLLVIGGPTHGHGVSAGIKGFFDALEPESLTGIYAAAFDTRLKMPELLTGAASHGITRRLQSKGAQVVAKPQSFLVAHGEGPLVEGELERARSWAGQLAVVIDDQP